MPLLVATQTSQPAAPHPYASLPLHRPSPGPRAGDPRGRAHPIRHHQPWLLPSDARPPRSVQRMRRSHRHPPSPSTHSPTPQVPRPQHCPCPLHAFRQRPRPASHSHCKWRAQWRPPPVDGHGATAGGRGQVSHSRREFPAHPALPPLSLPQRPVPFYSCRQRRELDSHTPGFNRLDGGHWRRAAGGGRRKPNLRPRIHQEGGDPPWASGCGETSHPAPPPALPIALAPVFAGISVTRSCGGRPPPTAGLDPHRRHHLRGDSRRGVTTVRLWAGVAGGPVRGGCPPSNRMDDPLPLCQGAVAPTCCPLSPTNGTVGRRGARIATDSHGGERWQRQTGARRSNVRRRGSVSRTWRGRSKQKSGILHTTRRPLADEAATSATRLTSGRGAADRRLDPARKPSRWRSSHLPATDGDE